MVAGPKKNPRSWVDGVLEQLETLDLSRGALAMLRGKSCSELCATISADPSGFNRLRRKLLLRDCADPYFVVGQSCEARSKKFDPYGGSVGGYTCHICLNVSADAKSCKAHFG